MIVEQHRLPYTENRQVISEEERKERLSDMSEYSKELIELGERRRYRKKYLYPFFARWGKIGSYAFAVAMGVLNAWDWAVAVITKHAGQ